jgi:hypothetical protein
MLVLGFKDNNWGVSNSPELLADGIQYAVDLLPIKLLWALKAFFLPQISIMVTTPNI